MNHTPTPWTVSMSDVIKGANGRLIADCETSPYAERPALPKPEDVANAEFIIRACNAHEELVAALKGCLSWLSSYPGGGAMTQYDKVRTLLATIEKGA